MWQVCLRLIMVELSASYLAQTCEAQREGLRGNTEREIAPQAVVVGHKGPCVSTTCNSNADTANPFTVVLTTDKLNVCA